MKFKNSFSIFIQDTIHKRKQISKKQCIEWLSLVAKNQSKITLRIVNEDESQKLNKQFRNKDTATNILSFLMEVEELMNIERIKIKRCKGFIS